MNVTFKQLGDPKGLIRKLEKNVGDKKFLLLLGEIAKKKTIEVIDSKRKNPVKRPEDRYQGKYTEHIKDVLSVDLLSNGDVGVGKISEMNARVPYWAVLNDGGYLPTPVRGSFTSSGRFVYNAQERLMTPKRPITGVRYVEEVTNYINNILDEVYSGVIKDKNFGESKQVKFD